MKAMIEMLDPKPGQLWSDLYTLNLVIREIARGRDSGLKLHPLDNHLRTVVLTRLEQFPKLGTEGQSNQQKGIAENGGDWYHFLSQTVFQSALKIRQNELEKEGGFDLLHNFEHATARGLYIAAPHLTKITRGSKQGSGLHIYPEILGRKAGEELAKELLK